MAVAVALIVVEKIKHHNNVINIFHFILFHIFQYLVIVLLCVCLHSGIECRVFVPPNNITDTDTTVINSIAVGRKGEEKERMERKNGNEK